MDKIDQLKTEVNDIKNSLDELKNDVSLSDIEKKTKVEELKSQAETTKQKIQNEIDSLENQTDDESKKKKEKAEALLTYFDETLSLYNSILSWVDEKKDLQAQQKENSGKEKSGFTKAKERVWEQWGDVINGDKRKEEPWKNIVRAVWFWVTWVAIYKWIKWLWNRAFWKKNKDKKEKDEKESEEKKWFWDKWYGKAIKRTGIWWWIYYIAKWLTTWDWSIFGWNPFSKEKRDWPNTTPWSNIERSEKAYDKLSEEDKRIYESSANAVNEYQWNIMWDINWSEKVEDLMWDSEFDKDKIWLVPFILSNRYENLNKMLSETSLYYEILGAEWHIVWDKLKNLWLDWLKKLLTPLVWAVKWLTFNLLNLDDWLDNLIDRLKWVDWLEDILRTVFRKSITVMSYYQSRKWALESYLAEQELVRQNPKFLWLSDEEKAEEIADYLHNDEEYKQHIEPEVSKFMKMSVKEATLYLQWKELLNWEMDLQMKTAINRVEKRRKDLLDIDDEDDISNLESMKSELQNWKLSDKYQRKLENICNEFDEEMEWFGRQSWWNNRLPILEMFDLDEDTLNKILSTWWYDDIISVYKEDLNSIREKNNNWTLSEADLENLEHSINDYYKFQKSLLSQSINLSESRDENWNVALRWVDKIYHSGEETVREVKVLIKWDVWDKMKAWGKIVWWAVSLDLLTYPIRFLTEWIHWRLAKSPTLKILWKGVVKPSAKLGAFAVERATWNVIRANLPSRVSYKYYNKDTFKIAVWRWEISLEKAAKIAKRQWLTFWSWNMAWNGKLVETPEDVIHYLFWPKQDAKKIVNILEKYGDNPRIYRELFYEHYDKVPSMRRKPQEWFHLNRSNMKFKVKDEVLNKLEDIAARIDKMTEWTQKTVMQSMMKSVKTIDQADNLTRIWVWDDMVRLLESWKFMKAEEYWKYLAKYAGKIDPHDIEKFEKFIIEARNSNKVGENGKLFVRNAMKNFWKIKENGFAVDKIDDLALNSNRRTKLAESTKANCAKMSSHLREMANNPKLKPFKPWLTAQSKAIDEASQTITPEWMKALKNMSIFEKETAFAKLTPKWITELSKLSNLLKNADNAKDLAKALKSANTIDNVKDILQQQWIVVNHIDDAVLLKIAKSGNVKRINDIVNYWAWYNTIKGVQKLMANPAIKWAWRVLWRALIVADFALVWYNFYSQFSEAQEIKKTNLERWEWREWQSYFELWAWWVWAIAWACMLIPWAWWIAWWVLLASMAVLEVGKKYYKDIEKFKQNQADFLAKWIAASKQELTSIDSWDQGLSRTWIDKMSAFDNDWNLVVSPLVYWMWKLWTSSVEKKKTWAPKTKAEALEALIRMEEIQKNPLAGADLNDPEIIKNPELMEAIRLAKEQVEEIVGKRFNYFKSNYLDQNKPLINQSEYEWNEAISAVEDLLEKSSINYIMESDPSYEWDKNPEKYKEAKLNKLKEWSERNFEKLEKLFTDNPTSLFQMYVELPYYKSMLFQYWDDEQIKLLDSCEYFEQYMSYKMMWKPVTSYPTIDINPDDIDYNQIHNLLSHFALIPTVLDDVESKNYKWLSDKDILDKYWISGILWQDILFECARLLNYDWKNSLDELKVFFHESKKEVNWIHFDEKKKKWYVNENRARDDGFATDSELDSLANIEKMRRYVNANVNSWWSGKMFTESGCVNKEIWNKMVKIIDDYIALRKWNIKWWIDDYVKTHTNNGKYIALPTELIIKWRKAWMKWVWEHLYKFENWKLVVK